MKLAIAIPFVVVGEICHHITWVCDEIAAHLTDLNFPALPEGGLFVDYVSH